LPELLLELWSVWSSFDPVVACEPLPQPWALVWLGVPPTKERQQHPSLVSHREHHQNFDNLFPSKILVELKKEARRRFIPSIPWLKNLSNSLSLTYNANQRTDIVLQNEDAIRETKK